MEADDVIKLLDSHTNEQVAYYPVTVWTDGTAMDDSKVDNVIYRRSSGKYYQRAFAEKVNVQWFGAKPDARYKGADGNWYQDAALTSPATDNTTAFNNAIKFCFFKAVNNDMADPGQNNNTKIIRVPGGEGRYWVKGNILVPRNISIHGERATLVGTGYSSTANDIFCSATVDANNNIIRSVAPAMDKGGSPIVNIGVRLIGVHIKGLYIMECGRAFDLYQFNEDCKLEDIVFQSCWQAVVSICPFYSQYKNLWDQTNEIDLAGNSNRTNGYSNSPEAAFEFGYSVNFCRFERLVVGTRQMAYRVYNTGFGNKFDYCDAEGVVTGFLFESAVKGCQFNGSYFEQVKDYAFRMSAGAGDSQWPGTVVAFMEKCEFDHIAWGGGTAGGFYGAQLADTSFGLHNLWEGLAGGWMVNIVNNYDDLHYRHRNVFIHTYQNATNISSVLRSFDTVQYQYINVPPAVHVVGHNIISDVINTESATPNLIRPKVNASTYNVLLDYTGMQGFIPTDIPLTTITTSISPYTAGQTFDVYIDTNIAFEYYNNIVFALQLADASSSAFIKGRIIGNEMLLTGYPMKQISLSNNNGKIRITIKSVTSNANNVYALEGIIRIA